MHTWLTSNLDGKVRLWSISTSRWGNRRRRMWLCALSVKRKLLRCWGSKRKTMQGREEIGKNRWRRMEAAKAFISSHRRRSIHKFKSELLKSSQKMAKLKENWGCQVFHTWRRINQIWIWLYQTSQEANWICSQRNTKQTWTKPAPTISDSARENHRCNRARFQNNMYTTQNFNRNGSIKNYDLLAKFPIRSNEASTFDKMSHSRRNHSNLSSYTKK